MRRDEEKQKIQDEVLAATLREAQKQEQVQGSAKSAPPRKQNSSQGEDSNNQKKDIECFYCKQKGHIRRNCPKKVKNEKNVSVRLRGVRGFLIWGLGHPRSPQSS